MRVGCFLAASGGPVRSQPSGEIPPGFVDHPTPDHLLGWHDRRRQSIWHVSPAARSRERPCGAVAEPGGVKPTAMPREDLPFCDCKWLERAAHDAHCPVEFDPELNEYNLKTSDGGSMRIYHCPFCAGRAPARQPGQAALGAGGPCSSGSAAATREGRGGHAGHLRSAASREVASLSPRKLGDMPQRTIGGGSTCLPIHVHRSVSRR